MDKEKLIKAGIYIALTIILCTVASRLLFNSGETLQDYAQKNPELAYAEKEEEISEEISEEVLEYSSAEDTEVVLEEVPAESESPDTSTEEELISPERVTYQENFYYEPLNEDLKLYITGTSFPAEFPCEITYDDLRYVHVLHHDFNGEIVEGELICNTAIARDLVEIFYELYKAEYQIEKIRLIDEYGGDDNLSMEDNNTSCFNYRVVDGTTKLSKHAYGLAIDINPFYNPYVRYDEGGSLHIDPAGSEPYADRLAAFPYKIDENDLCLKLFKEHGFIWGGDWNSMKDYQHFQKVLD